MANKSEKQPAVVRQPTVIQATPVREPELHWTFTLLTKEYPSLTKFLIHIALFMVGALAVTFLYQQFIIPGKEATIVQKDATIGEKDATIKNIEQERDAVNRENEKLRSENALYQAAHDEKTFPLKKRVQILVRQINDFADDVEKGTIQYMQRQNEWSSRFEPRINVLISQLDEQGQHSEKFEQQENYNEMNNHFPNYIRGIATELNKLGDGLPDINVP